MSCTVTSPLSCLFVSSPNSSHMPVCEEGLATTYNFSHIMGQASPSFLFVCFLAVTQFSHNIKFLCPHIHVQQRSSGFCCLAEIVTGCSPQLVRNTPLILSDSLCRHTLSHKMGYMLDLQGLGFEILLEAL